MFCYSTSVRTAFAPTSALVTVVGFLTVLISASQVFATETCQSALESPSGFTALGNGDSMPVNNGVVEWDGEVIRVRPSTPGVLTISATGSGSQGALYTEGSSSTLPLVDSAVIGVSQRELKAVVGAGNHCIQLHPGSGASGDIEVTAAFEDVCHNDDPGDDGDSFTCA